MSDPACGNAVTCECDPNAQFPGVTPPEPPSNIAGALDGLMWAMPCTGALAAGVCPCSNPADVTSVVAGQTGRLYTVVLRIRGFVEFKDYSAFGGSAVGAFFTCSNPTIPLPVGGGNANQYVLRTTDPAATYFLNHSLVPPANALVVDYYATLTLRTGCIVTLKAFSIDGFEYGNPSNILIPPPPPPMQGSLAPYNGQILSTAVVSIV